VTYQRKIEELPPLEVGRRYYRLTCTSVRPTIFRCDCGAEVRNRSLTHIRGGMRSCGCMMREGKAERMRRRFAELKLVLVAEHAAEKQQFSTWDVRCLRCGEASTIGDTHLRFGRVRRKCKKCPRQSTNLERRTGA
jgi:hypothetical protein